MSTPSSSYGSSAYESSLFGGRPLSEVMPLVGLLGIETVSVSPDEIRLRLPWSTRVCTSGGIMHGGALMALADTAGAMAAAFHLPGGAGTTTTDSNTRFLGAVRQGAVEAVTRVLHKGRTLIVIDTEVRDDAGRLVARTSQTQLVLQPR
jgi:1,4-dihydroxy-2-naphthoyl-CoA hydrolase